MDLLFTLRIARLNPPQVFTGLVFLGSLIIVLFTFPLLYLSGDVTLLSVCVIVRSKVLSCERDNN